MLNKKVQIAFVLFLLSLILTGCFYPNERRIENQVPSAEQVAMVQNAVNSYKEKTGVLPIHTRDAETPLYEKYIVDFRELMNLRLLSSIPANSFEAGGTFRYVIINVETEPLVKLIDLRLAKTIGELQLRVNEYLKNDYLPVDRIIDESYYLLDYKKLNLKSPPQVPSPYSQTYLPIIANRLGQLGVDYRIDLFQTLEKMGDVKLEEGGDIRYILMENSLFAPAYSFPYDVKNGEPVLRK
jgi:hypothetical protein